MVWYVDLPYTGREPKFKWDDDPDKTYGFGISAGRVWPPEDVALLPSRGTQLDSKKMCGFFSMPSLNACNDRFKSVIEEFEPGVHQFMPIRLFAKDGAEYADNYYIFNCGQQFPSILVEESNLMDSWGVISGGRHKGMPYVDGGSSGLVFSMPKIAGRHAWINQLCGPRALFFSDELMNRMKKEGIKYLSCSYQQIESDRPWIAEEQIQPWLDWAKDHPDQAFELGE